MKKNISLALALVMMLSLSIPTFASDNPSSAATSVSYVGTGNEEYTITVPANMEPGDTAEIQVTGTWASNRKVTVTAPETVTLTNSIDGGEKELDITFDGVSEVGDNTVENTVTANISMEMIEDAMFGTWSGNIEFSVSVEDAKKDLSEVVTNLHNCEGYASVSAPSGMQLIVRKYYYASASADYSAYTSYEDTAMTECASVDFYGNNYEGSYETGGYARLVVIDSTGTYDGEVALTSKIGYFNFCTTT